MHRSTDLPATPAGRVLTLSHCRVDLAHQKADWGNGTVSNLTSRETELLEYLSQRPSAVVSREDLYRSIWGYHSSSLSRAVDTAIKRLREKIEVNPSEPQHIFTAHGAGYRFEPADEPKPSPQPVAEPVAPPPPRLSTPAAPLGRNASALELVRLLQSGERLITLLGPPGIGKTTLARHVGHLLCRQPTGALEVWFCDLTEARGPEDMITRLLTTLDAMPASGDHLETYPHQLERHLRSLAPALIILDNFEHLTDLAPETLGQWLALPMKVQFLVTSREQLPLQAGVSFVVAPLAQAAAEALFVERARAAQRDFVPAPAQRQSIRDIAEQLQGVPLALELAASRINVLQPAQILARLKAPLTLLRRSRPGQPHRHDTMRQAIDGSWEMLSGIEQDAFAQLGVFRGGFTLAAAEAVVDVSHHPDPPPLLDVIQLLLSRSLIHTLALRPDQEEPRFNLYPCIHEYAGERLEQDPRRDAVRQRHARYFVALGETMVASSGSQRPTIHIERLLLERANFDALYQQELPHGSDMLVRVTLILHRILTLRESMTVRLARLNAVAAVSTAVALPLRIQLHLARWNVVTWAGGWSARAVAQARAELEQVVVWARTCGDTQGEAQALLGLGGLSTAMLQPLEGKVYLEQALIMFRALGNTRFEGVVLSYLASLHERLDPPHAEELYQQALTIALQLGNTSAQTTSLMGLGELCIEAQRLADAQSLSERLLQRSHTHQFVEPEGNALSLQGMILWERGALHEAEAAHRAAIAIFRSTSNPLYLGFSLCQLGCLLYQRGRPAEAVEAHREGAALISHWPSPERGQYLGSLAVIEAAAGNLREARAALAQCEESLVDTRHADALEFLATCRQRVARALAGAASPDARPDADLSAAPPSAYASAPALSPNPPTPPAESPLVPIHVRAFMLRRVKALQP